MSSRRQQLGKRGEELARRHLERIGYSVLQANYRAKAGEIDLVTEKEGALVFVEVRTRRGAGFGSPEESVTQDKRSHLVAAAQEYLQANDAEHRNWRIDVVAVELDPRGRFIRLDVVENAVEL